MTVLPFGVVFVSASLPRKPNQFNSIGTCLVPVMPICLGRPKLSGCHSHKPTEKDFRRVRQVFAASPVVWRRGCRKYADGDRSPCVAQMSSRSAAGRGNSTRSRAETVDVTSRAVEPIAESVASIPNLAYEQIATLAYQYWQERGVRSARRKRTGCGLKRICRSKPRERSRFGEELLYPVLLGSRCLREVRPASARAAYARKTVRPV